MKNTLGAILIGVGVLSTSIATLNARTAPNTSYLVGTFLPGTCFLIIGLALRRKETPATPDLSPKDAVERAGLTIGVHSNRFKTKATLGVGAGIVTMFVGSGLAQQGPNSLLAGIVVSLCGWALLLWGCVNYARWKGHSGWLGLLGYLLLPGLAILACFPNRRKRLVQNAGSGPVAELESIALEDRRPGLRFLLALVPLGVVFVTLAQFFVSTQSNIASAEWKELAPPGSGFRALMPGAARQEQKTQETPTGTVKLHKFIVEPAGKNELFMIVVIHLPEEVANQLGGSEKLLELGRQDILTASEGRLQSEKEVVLGDVSGLELEVLPPKGAIIKARVYATNQQVYQVTAHIPKIRLASEDVQKFLDSFTLFADSTASSDRARE